MVEEQGVVVALDEGAVWVETLRKTACSGCRLKNGCGQHLADKYRSGKNISYIRATSQWHVSEGDQVVLGIPEHALLKASFIVYLLPLVLLVSALWFSAFARLNDMCAILLAAAALFVGFWLSRIFSSKGQDVCQVSIVRVLPPVPIGGQAVETLKVL